MVKNPFRTYDIRGIVGESITPELAYKVGRAFAEFLKAEQIAVGYDMRESSSTLASEFMRGVCDQGVNVINLGLCTTPMLSFVVAELSLSGGVMITASHNPSEYNGLKLIGAKGLQLYKGAGIEVIEEMVLEKSFGDLVADDSRGEVSELDSLFAYTEKLKDSALAYSGLKIVCDYGNGVGAISSKRFFSLQDCEVTHLYAQPDGSFPNHPANPHDLENVSDLQKAVVSAGADIGIFFDGDADRSFFVDETGTIVMPDLLLALLAQHELLDEDNSGEKVYYDLRMSKVVGETVSLAGGIPEMMRVGNPFYKEKLVREGGILAGELSGHIMFADHHGIDDGLYCAIKVLNIMVKTGKKLSELILPLASYCGSEEINLRVSDADKVLAACDAAFVGGKRLYIDGIYVNYDLWWFNVRKSNTEPLVRVRLEAHTAEALEEKKEKLLSVIEPFLVSGDSR